jgi:hydrogenase maturation protease
MTDLLEQLQHCFHGRVGVMGLGNVDHSDDGFGVYLAESMTTRLTRSGKVSLARNVISAGTMPERYISYVTAKGFDHLVFLDAVEFGGEPGSVLLLKAEETAARFPQISTHKMSIGLLAHLINEGNRMKVWLLGVQPGSLKPGQGLSPAVQKTMEILDKMLFDMWMSRIGEGDNGKYHDPNNSELNRIEPPRREGLEDLLI